MNEISMNAIATLPHRHDGAARVSIFFALWALALVLMHDVRVSAAPVYETPSRSQPAWWIAPPPVPKLDSASMWNALSERSDVISGRWNVTDTARSVSEHREVERVAHTASLRVEALAKREAVAPKARRVTEAVKRSSSTATIEARVARKIASRDFSGAMEALATVRAENPKTTQQTRLLEAHVAIGQGDSERAYTILLEALPDIRIATQQHDLLAAVMLRTSRYAEAATVYRALLTVDPTNARWWAGYAISQQRLGHRAEMVSAYRSLRALAPEGTALATWANERLERIG